MGKPDNRIYIESEVKKILHMYKESSFNKIFGTWKKSY